LAIEATQTSSTFRELRRKFGSEVFILDEFLYKEDPVEIFLVSPYKDLTFNPREGSLSYTGLELPNYLLDSLRVLRGKGVLTLTTTSTGVHLSNIDLFDALKGQWREVLEDFFWGHTNLTTEKGETYQKDAPSRRLHLQPTSLYVTLNCIQISIGFSKGQIEFRETSFQVGESFLYLTIHCQQVLIRDRISNPKSFPSTLQCLVHTNLTTGKA
jgi:hypothetical protein